MTRVKLYDNDMNEIIMRGVKWLEFTPTPVDAERQTDRVYNQEVLLGITTGPRLIDAKLWFTAADPNDYILLRNELYGFLSPLKNMWAVDSKFPGVKWWVNVESLSKPKRINGRTGECEVVFKSPTIYARSIGDSLTPFSSELDVWATGMGLLSDAQNYIINNKTAFQIHNPGDALVDPREHELEITFDYFGATVGGLEIRNDTTGDVWKYTGPLSSGDTIVIDGVVSKRNSANIVGATNFGLITLAEGFNDIKILQTNGFFDISFRFPFLYV